MSDYVRPAVPPQRFTDAAGNAIAYGDRWPTSPPSESYSVVTHPERFAPLHTVADALIAWLCDVFEVTRVEGPGFAADLVHQPFGVERAVRLTPRDPDAAVLTFVFTALPGVIVHAGVLHDFPFPACGCDACDETWEQAADALEWTVRTVVEGGYAEAVRTHGELPVGFWLDEVGVASQSGAGRAEDYPPDRLRTALERLGRLPRDAAWAPWPTLWV